MKKTSVSILAITAILASSYNFSESESNKQGLEKSDSLQSKEAQLSYFFGYRDVQNFISEGLTIDLKAFEAGVEAAKQDVESEVDQEEAAELGKYFTEHIKQQKQNEIAQALAHSEVFLAENAAKPSVITTESGLQYKVLELGEGEKPTASSVVQVHYEGRLISGEVFDSSIARGMSAQFPLSGVIAGWTEGLQLMPEGSKYEFYIPSDLAYGEQGTASIGPNEALIFTVELIKANYSSE